MFSLRVSIVALLAITLMARFDQGAALKCYDCISITNPDCADSPEKTTPSDCTSIPIPSIPSNAPIASARAGTAGETASALEAEAQKNLDALHEFSKYTSNMTQARDGFTMVCWKTVAESNGAKVVVRKCMPKGSCSSVIDGSGIKCNECDTDLCNASSRITLGIMSIFIPVGLIAIFFR